jgi:hypothetical protein
MATSRYITDARINLGQQLGTPNSMLLLKRAIKDGVVPVVSSFTLTGNDRLDSLAGTVYGDAKYWWVLAVASGIGWGLQAPPGTVINVVKLEDALLYVR